MNPISRHSAVCTVCSFTSTNPNRAGLMAHQMTMKHQKNLQANKHALSIDKFDGKLKEPSIQDKIANAEMLFTGFMAEHNTPFA